MWFHGSIYDLEWKNYHGIKRYIYKALFKMQKNALKKVLDISESYGIFINVYFGIKTILFKNNMKSK